MVRDFTEREGKDYMKDREREQSILRLLSGKIHLPDECLL